MSDKSELKAELERKKQRLAQIREEKKRKEEERKKKETDQKKEAVAPVQEESDLEKKRREAEALLQSMGLTPESPIAEQPLRVVTADTCLFHYLVPPPMSPSSKSVSTPSEAGSQDSGDGAVGSRTLHWDTDPSVLQLHSDSDLGRGPIKLG
ncbi:DYNC1I2 isoform 12, partial [Pan troglodytes]